MSLNKYDVQEIYEMNIKINKGLFDMAWPTKKVNKSAPFTYTGIDYLGPLCQE